MTISSAVPGQRRPLTDRVARWVLDTDGDLYGDERERLRWYEGIAVAASLQWLAVPWASAVLVWALGRPSVLPLVVVMAATYLPTLFCMAYMRRRRVDAAVRTWSRKTVLRVTLFGVPYVAFLAGCLAAYTDSDNITVRAMTVGALVGATVGAVATALAPRGRRRREEATMADVD